MMSRLFLCVLILLAASFPAVAEDAKPYVVKDGKTDQATYNGWRRYSESCLRCHGPDGAGSSYAPDLTASLKSMSEDIFKATVMGGRVNVSQANQNVMPSFADVEDVAQYIDDIYGYLKARSDGVLDRGRPERFTDKPKS
jgi:mono/diheme cytochrome c family protein